MTTSTIQRTIETVWRIEAPKLIAALTRLVRDVGLAEELAQDALVIALQQWPEEGIPRNPAAWLMGTAKHRAIDLIRRQQTAERKYAEIGRELEQSDDATSTQLERIDEDAVDDDLLRLIFIACHPVLAAEARVALTLRLLGGLTVEEIGRAFLTTGHHHCPAV
ncbi:MAG: sigma factor [Caldilineaceae bacterium]